MNNTFRQVFRLTTFVAVFFFLLMVPTARSDEAKTIRVLFIGNSLTTANNLPQLTADLAKSRNYTMEYDVYAPGGQGLREHASDPVALNKIKEKGWDFVVLQEQGQRPSFDQDQVEQEVYPYAQKLSELIREANPQAHVVFYMTMARRDGDLGNARKVSPELATYEGMQNRINESYLKMTGENNALIAPVGLVWKKVRQQYPSIGLYADETHPNLTGAYLTACVFYSVFFKDISMTGLPHPSTVDRKTVSIIQKLIQETLKSPADWYLSIQHGTTWESKELADPLKKITSQYILVISGLSFALLIYFRKRFSDTDKIVDIIGTIQAGICLLLGVPIFSIGFLWFLSDVIAVFTGGGGNLTGLGMMIGGPMAGVGIIFLFGFMSAVLLLQRKPHGRGLTLLSTIIITAVIFFSSGISLFPLSLMGFQISLWLRLLIGIFNIALMLFLIQPLEKSALVKIKDNQK